MSHVPPEKLTLGDYLDRKQRVERERENAPQRLLRAVRGILRPPPTPNPEVLRCRRQKSRHWPSLP